MTHCIIGAGFSGLPIAKKLLELGEQVDVLDKNAGTGGLWHTGVYRDAHIISSRNTTQFPDFPMPPSYPDFPNKQQMQQYFQQYADYFEISEHIEFNTEVVRVTPLSDGTAKPRWQVALRNGDVREYATVTVANGHNWSPKKVKHQGVFNGQIMQSDEYYEASILRGKRVLVVGYGNTGCDLAVDASREAACSHISMRSGSYFFPKLFMGIPVADLLYNSPIKFEWLERITAKIISYIAIGDLQRYGIPKPKQGILDRHPIVNTDLVNRIRHGKIQPKADIDYFDGDTVHFKDGSTGDYDLIVYCTGYQLSLPMLDPKDNILAWQDAKPLLFLRNMSPNFRGIFFPGIGQARTGGGPLYQEGGYLIARMAAYDGHAETSLKNQLQAHRDLKWAQAFGMKLIELADLASHGITYYKRRISALNRILNSIGCPISQSRLGQAVDKTNPVLPKLCADNVVEVAHAANH